MNLSSFFFDQRDHDLIKIINSIYEPEKSLSYTNKVYYPLFHPLGIKELAESKGIRIAYAIASLLESIEHGTIETRLQALRSLKDEIIHTASGSMPKNTARVLFQIMKELIRARGNDTAQLELAHSFRMAAFGKPRVIRKLLRHYELLEMPEEWNQITFDDHVHDMNTTGRKSPTLLIMDAWIKGITRLRVIYYHCIEPKFVLELIQSAKIMEIDLRIGIEFWARYCDRYISFIWVARNISDAESFICFLAEPHVAEFMDQGKQVLKYLEKYVLKVLNSFNDNYHRQLCLDLGIEIPLINSEQFLKFVFPNQPSIIHLGEYISILVKQAVQERINKADFNCESSHKPNEEEKQNISNLKNKQLLFNTNEILSRYLSPMKHPQIPHPFSTSIDIDIPARLKMHFTELIAELKKIHHDFRLTLKLGSLKPEDVAELLYDGKGLFNRLEIINLKDFNSNDHKTIVAINELQRAINEGSLLKLKTLLRKIILTVEKSEYPDKEDRIKKLLNILYDVDTLKDMYVKLPLKSRIGSDYTGKSHQPYDMGFGIIPTLSHRARKEIRKNKNERLILPASINIRYRKTSSTLNELSPFLSRIIRNIGRIFGLEHVLPVKKREWIFGSFALDMKSKGNIVSLSSIQKTAQTATESELASTKCKKPYLLWKNLNTKLKNAIKIFIGFAPAFLCFFLTKDWWFLAYFGAVIWFGITGFRVILQSVLGGGGINRSSLIKWNNYVSWERFTDALLFTGFSVPLLDYLVKTLILNKGFGINTSTNPVMLYMIMGIANGIYLSCHNTFRGLPRGMITGNFFRSILSIPVAVLFNSIVGSILTFFNFPAVDTILQKWAAIISKAASDTVAGCIEGTVDRFSNFALRKRDITKKFSDLFETYTKLALLFPEKEELTILEKPEKLFESKNSEVRDLTIMIIISALDLFYFWMYLPRARIVMLDMVAKLSAEEKIIFVQSQRILEQEQHISRLFVDGILGKNFPGPLSFYLSTYNNYLNAIIKSTE